jgi:hypothetical protein
MASNPRVTKRTQAGRIIVEPLGRHVARGRWRYVRLSGGRCSRRRARWSAIIGQSVAPRQMRSAMATTEGRFGTGRVGLQTLSVACVPRWYRRAPSNAKESRPPFSDLRRCFDPVGSGVGSRAFRFESVIFVREIRLDISRQPPQRLSRARWNRGVSGSRRTMPKERCVR